MAVTTPPRGKRREQCKVPNKAASDFNLEDSQLQLLLRTDEQGTRDYGIFRQLEEKRFIDQSAENLKQEELQNETTRAEEERVKAEQDRVKAATRVEQDRVTTFTRVEEDRARMEADRVTTFAMEDADRHGENCSSDNSWKG